jgi:ADP-ribosylglycohydrolase
MVKRVMIGAIIGDVIGSVFEWHNTKSTEFDLYSRFTRFTDDTALTIAVADAILHLPKHKFVIVENHLRKRMYSSKLKQYARWYPNVGYGESFERWVKSESSRPYRSYGNGSAMRVSPIGYAFTTIDEVRLEARRSAAVTHNHKQGIRGAEAIASAIFLARNERSKEEIKSYIKKEFRYNLDLTLDQIRPSYTFHSSCQGSVPQAIIAFLESADFEDAIRKAISLGGDSDTIACMTGGIAQSFYKQIPSDMISEVMLRLDLSLKKVVYQFNERFGVEY